MTKYPSGWRMFLLPLSKKKFRRRVPKRKRPEILPQTTGPGRGTQRESAAKLMQGVSRQRSGIRRQVSKLHKVRLSNRRKSRATTGPEGGASKNELAGQGVLCHHSYLLCK